MPVYTTKAEMLEAHGVDEITVASDSDASGSVDDAEIDRWIRGAASEIECYAEPYGVVPTGVTAEALATAGTYPRWWKYANIDIGLYRMALDAGAYTEEKRKRYEDWVSKLKAVYPTVIEDGQSVAAGGTVSIVAGGDREFSAAGQVGL